MSEDIVSVKQSLRAQALRMRGLLSLNSEEIRNFSKLFFDTITLSQNFIVACYWPKDREFDTRPLIDDLLARSVRTCLPVIAKGSKILKFVPYNHNTELVIGAYGVAHPAIDDNTLYLEPDIIITPMLAFDRRGARLGYGGGYYDATLYDLAQRKKIITIGAAFAQQACLFNLPTDEHDIPMDYVITQQQVFAFT